MKLSIFFIDSAWGVASPVYFYSNELVKKYGYESKYVLIDNSSINVAGFMLTDKFLSEYDMESIDELLLIGLGEGSVYATYYASEYSDKCKNIKLIMYSPRGNISLNKVNNSCNMKSISFIGKDDEGCDYENIKRQCDINGTEIFIIDDANEQFESASIKNNIRNIQSIMQKSEAFIAGTVNPNLKQALNPYMGGNEYVPDGEPYVFGDRVYVYGSHDMFNGNVYCMLDYICWSAPVNDLGNWRYEGIIYRIDQDLDNKDSSGKLYAPDVAKGIDGRYYLYYAINSQNHISVAVCDEPAGKYEFYGFVHYKDGTRLGDKESDEMQFDPGVLLEDDKVYLYTGFCPEDMESRHGAMLTVLDKDMVTIIEEPTFVAPSAMHSKGTGFEGHEFFEAPSIRKIGDKYTFIYSSVKFHELCYAQSDSPKGPFVYKGVIISNGDLHIDTYKDADKCTYYCANNHGSIEKVSDDWFIFYHRHTNGTNYSRQACFEKLEVNADGTIKQAMMTSCGGIKPLIAKGTYPAYIACNLYTEDDLTYIQWTGWLNDQYPIITQDGRDGDESPAYITNMLPGTTAGFKSFDFDNVKSIEIETMGYGSGPMEFRLSPDGPIVGAVEVASDNVWKKYVADVTIDNGVHDLYITFNGEGWSSIKEFTFITK